MTSGGDHSFRQGPGKAGQDVADELAGALGPLVAAALYVGAAQDDPVFGPDQHERLRTAFDAPGVRARIENYPAAHGFAVPDNPTYDAAADRRHQEAQDAFFAMHLRR